MRLPSSTASTPDPESPSFQPDVSYFDEVRATRRRTPEPANPAYPGLVNSGVDGILSALELMGATEGVTLRQADEGGRA